MLNVILRTLLLYALVIAAMRFMGKKQLGELQPSELVITILISNIATLALEDPSMPLLMGVLPILAIAALDIFVSFIMLKCERIRRIITGSPRIVIKDGKIQQGELRTLRYTLDDITEAMREQGIFDIEQVQYAIVETTGKINFFEKSDTGENPPATVVKDGVISKAGLIEAGVERSYIEGIITGKHLTLPEVFLMTLRRDGGYTLIRKDRSGK